MVYDPTKDFLGLWRNIAGQVSKLEMPGLDYTVQALARAGLLNLSVSATQPVANQSTTAWLRTAVPSYSAEGALFLWDKVTTAYLAATPALLLQFLEASAGQNGSSWYAVVGGAPSNVLGLNGDFAVRTDEPGGIYGPKAAGAWPPFPVPGTVNTITSGALDNTFGSVEGDLIYRDVALWQALAIGAPNSLLVSLGGIPTWEALSILMDTVFGGVQGSVMYRDAAVWNDLPPGAAGNILSTNGPAANPSWVPRTAEFVSGTVLVFYQAAAPTGWTKQVAVTDYGMRVTSGVGGVVTAGSAFSTVFAQTAVGAHTLSVGEMPNHSHTTDARKSSGAQSDATPGSILSCDLAATVNAQGGGGSHTHSINLTLAYVDVIIASKN